MAGQQGHCIFGRLSRCVMKITSSNCWLETLKFREGYSFDHENKPDSCDNVFLTLETDEGLQGWGMAAPDEVITGEDAQSVLKAYKNHIEDCMKGENPFFFSSIYEELRDKRSEEHTSELQSR